MTEKDYILIAKVFRDYWDEDKSDWVNTRTYKLGLAAKFAEALARDNPRFQENKFMSAVRGEKVS